MVFAITLYSFFLSFLPFLFFFNTFLLSLFFMYVLFILCFPFNGVFLSAVFHCVLVQKSLHCNLRNYFAFHSGLDIPLSSFLRPLELVSFP
jgi:hypothetical protein